MDEAFPYETPVAAVDVGMDGRRLENVAAVFRRQQADGAFPGGQLVVRRRGRVVLNLACGLARGWHGRPSQTPLPVRADTPFPVYSTGKPLAAVVIAMLESSGVLSVMQPVAAILPEFAGLGRQAITLLDVLTHRAGIILPQLIDQHEVWADPQAVWQHLLATPPRYPRGTFAYMPGEYGVILDQVVRRLCGRGIAEVFADDLARPLGLRNLRFGLHGHELQDIAWSYWLGGDRLMIAGMNVAEDFEVRNNSAAVFSAGNPAFSMVADAASLAAVYEFLVAGGRSRDHRQLINADQLRLYTTRQVAGWNRSVGAYLSLGRGFMLGTAAPSFFGWWGSGGCFGHPGMFSSLAFADHTTGLAAAIVTNGNRGIGDFFRRSVALTHGLRRACRE